MKMTKNLFNMVECDYSFEMLYKAAFGKKLPISEKNRIQQLPQNKINLLVKDWANMAGWQTVERIGLDKQTYLAFFP